VFENAPYPTELNQIACRHGGGSSLSVGDLVFVDAPKPMIFMCASVGYVQLSNKFVDAFKDIGPAIIVGEHCVNDTWAA
jgi:type IV secretory pathway protease TraF